MFSMQRVFFHLLYYTLATLNTKHEMCSRINRLDKVTKTKADGAIRTPKSKPAGLIFCMQVVGFH